MTTGGDHARFVGAVDKFSPNALSGWVFDTENFGTPLRVSVFVNGMEIASTDADLPRPDLASANGGDARCGFELFFDQDVLWDDMVLVRASSGDAAWTIPNKLWSEVEGHVEGVTADGATGWVWMPRFPNSHLDVIAKLDGNVIARVRATNEREDLLRSGRGAGNFGFQIQFGRRLHSYDGLEFFAVGDGVEAKLHVSDATPLFQSHARSAPETSRRHDAAPSPAGYAPFAEHGDPRLPEPPAIHASPAGESRPYGPRLGMDKQGRKFGLSIERVVAGPSCRIMTGWFFGPVGISFSNLREHSDATPDEFAMFVQNEVAATYGQRREDCHGFVAIWNKEDEDGLAVAIHHEQMGSFGISVDPDDLSDADLDTVLAELQAFTGTLLKGLCDHPQIVSKLVPRISELPGHSPYVRGYIETARGVPGEGGLVAGWLIHEPGVELYLVSSAGHVQSMRRAARWHRHDIIEAMGAEFGSYAQYGGILQGWPHPFQLGDEIRIVAVIGNQAFVVSSSRWVAAPIEPVGFARWAFSYPTPAERFSERLSDHDGELICKLIARAISRRPADPPRVYTFGEPPRNPRCAVIIPLYRRYDFMMNQFIEFARDRYLRDNAEIIYVVDDPTLAGPVQIESERFYKRFGVPFRVVWAGQNRGFAGANNVGISQATAPYILLLNSDVIPTRPGWLRKMVEYMDENDDVGVLGARLHFPNGSIQHDGMAFRWSADWGAYLNKHPGAGLKLPVDSARPVERPAVTAACALLRRDEYHAIGGLDEGFLIGDFEDSDLCLKMRAWGRKVACMQDIDALVHLERQSFSAIGAVEFRDYVARFNAWRHQTKWGSYIDSLPSYDEMMP